MDEIDEKNYNSYGSEELEETMAAGGDIFRETEEDTEIKPKLKLVKNIRDKLEEKKKAK